MKLGFEEPAQKTGGFLFALAIFVQIGAQVQEASNQTLALLLALKDLIRNFV